jgi:transposase
VPKAQDGTVEMLRWLRVARQTAVKARTQALNAAKALLVTAPDQLRERLDGLPTAALLRQAAALEPGKPATRRRRRCWRCAAWPSATSTSTPRSRP